MTPDEVVKEAETWLDTPFHDKAAIKGAGVDCGYFPFAVYRNCDLIRDSFKMPDYSPQFWCHRGDEIYLRGLQDAGFKEVPGPRRGDLVVSLYGRVYSHGAIIVDWPRIIHANPDAKRVKYDSAEVYRLYCDKPKKYFTLFT